MEQFCAESDCNNKDAIHKKKEPQDIKSTYHLKLRAVLKPSEAWLAKHMVFSDVSFTMFISWDFNQAFLLQFEGK